MPRQPRLELPGVPMHVVQRGVNRCAIFLDDEDPGKTGVEKRGQVHLSIDGAGLAWPMRGPDARKAAGLRFDHRPEGVMAQCSLLLQMKADAGEQFVG